MTELCEIADGHGTDKAPWCWNYTPIYYDWLNPVREKMRTVLEIGVLKGQSLRTWRDFFPNANVYGVDNEERWMISEPRIKTFLGDAYEHGFMSRVLQEVGPVDFFVDDAMHHTAQQVDLLTFTWPSIREDGIYAIEEAHNAALQALFAVVCGFPDCIKFSAFYKKEGYSLLLLQKGPVKR